MENIKVRFMSFFCLVNFFEYENMNYILNVIFRVENQMFPYTIFVYHGHKKILCDATIMYKLVNDCYQDFMSISLMINYVSL